MDDGYAAGIAAIARATDAGFRFLHVRDANGEVIGIHAERRRSGAVDTFDVTDVDEAHATRYRVDDFGRTGGDPIWQTSGTVPEVINDLLALPPHGTAGAPSLARRARSGMWLPGDHH